MKTVHNIYHRIVGPWVALVVGAFVAAATSPSFGQLTFDQNSYVRIDDSNTSRTTLASQIITPIPGGQSISFGAVDSDSVSGGGLIGSFDYFSSVLGSGTARYGSLGGKIDTNESGTFDNGDIQGLLSELIPGPSFTVGSAPVPELGIVGAQQLALHGFGTVLAGCSQPRSADENSLLHGDSPRGAVTRGGCGGGVTVGHANRCI